ncbi:CDHR1-like protein [Mya arenaria]|uniref:CDHR1-like protein n=1 Tax=Mya arenaria TaxID=6604 RepID=A0ABY7DCH9_MYAAR|nr:CDHR1-like protein [Mya arenaria]
MMNVITCSASCFPQCTMTWMKTGKIISSSSELNIEQLEREEAGVYVCTARNPSSSQYNHTALFTFNVTDDGASISVEPADDTTRRFVTVHVSGGPSPWTVTVRNSIPLDKDIATGGQSSIGLRFSLSDADGNTIVTRITTLYLTDVNDNAPVFLNKPYTWYIYEKPYNTSTFYKINATDFDSNRNGRISYFMQSQHTASEYLDAFSIDIVSGMVHLQKPLDYETNNFYQFTITAMDGGSPPLTTTTDLIISVRDVQDTAPFFTGGPYHAEVQEEVPRGTYVLRVNAVDGDTGSPNNIIYTMLNNTVLDINDNAPIFSQKFYTAYIPDNSSPGSAITVANEIIVKDNDEITATGPPPLQFESSALLNITITPGGTYLCNGGHTQNVAVSSTFPINTTPITTSPLPVPGNGEQQIVSLNVGGSVFQTSLATIQRVPANSVLMATPSFIDRDPTHFRVILDYLRDKGSFDAGRLPSHILDLHEIIAEAMYYQLDELAHISSDYTNGKVLCKAVGGYPVMIQTKTESDYLKQQLTIAGSGIVYIGLVEQSHGVWVWDKTQTALTFQEWALNEPYNCYPCIEQCVGMVPTTSSSWNDLACGLSLPMLCELNV